MMHYDSLICLGSHSDYGINALSKICEMPFQLLTINDVNNKCIFCGARGAFFKCAVGHCINYYHLNCNQKGLVIISRENGRAKMPHYRFTLCHLHQNSVEIDLVEQQFYEKISSIFSHDDLRTAMASVFSNASSSVDSTTPPSSRSTVSEASNITTRGKDAKQQTKKDRKTTSTRGVASHGRSKEEHLADNQMLTGSDGSLLLQQMGLMPSDGRCLLVDEYLAIRRNGSQRNVKKFDWDIYKILFAKFNADLLQPSLPHNIETCDLNSDLRMVLSLDGCVESPSDISRLTLESEPSIMNITNSMSMQLRQRSTLLKTSEEAEMENNSASRSVESSAESYADLPEFLEPLVRPSTPVEHVSPHYDNRMIHSAMEVMEVYGYRTHRPHFVLVKFGNRAAWLSVAVLKSKRHGTIKSMLLDYIAIGMLEYEYLKRVLRLAYYLPKSGRVIPIIHLPKDKAEKKTNDYNERRTLGGFSWNVTPSVEGYLHTTLITPLKLSDEYSGQGKTLFDGILNIEDVQSNMLYDPEDEAADLNFVNRQANVLVAILRSVNKAIEEQKQRLLKSLSIEVSYQNRLHEDAGMISQYVKLTLQMTRWSHFRQFFMYAVEMFNNVFEYESQKETNNAKTLQLKAESTLETDDKEFCSVCLMSEQAQKQTMTQCARCYIRVHNKCYIAYKNSVPEPAPTDSKAGTYKNDWYCEPCEYEVLMNANSKTATCNNVVCCACYSSGGAFKRVTEMMGKKIQQGSPVKWIHLHCVALLLPRVVCQEWVALSRWELRNVVNNDTEICKICSVNGGFMLTCAHPRCNVIFHTTCAWVEGAYVKESPYHNSSEIETIVRNLYPNSELFPTISLRVYCIQHSIELFSEQAVKKVKERKCIAYTHYRRCPWYSTRKNPEPKQITLPLTSCPAPVEITLNGAIETVEADGHKRKVDFDVTSVLLLRAQSRPKQRKSLTKIPSYLAPSIQQVRHVAQQCQDVLMMNYQEEMLNNAQNLLVDQVQPQPMMNNHMIMNPEYAMMMSNPMAAMMNPQHMGMMVSHPTMMTNPMQKPMLQPMMYNAPPQYMTDRSQYVMNMPTGHMQANSYANQLARARMGVRPMSMPPTMMVYPTGMNMMPMNQHMMQMAQHPYMAAAYAQPVPMMPEYWDQGNNMMQYNDQQPHIDNTYVNGGDTGYQKK
eukprot:XP_001610978.1 hypothetical protein [Babesia bovis T2Bo]